VKRIRLVVADDHPLFVEGVRAILESTDDIEVVGKAETAAKLLPLIANTMPDFVLMDFLGPKLDGLACLDRIRDRFPTVKVALISGLRDPGVIEAVLRRGACAFVLKSIDPEDLAAVIRQIMGGTVFQALEFAEPNADEPVRLAGLTEREVSILQALARGLPNAAIAKELWITRETVKFHLRNIYRKLDVSNRTEAVRYAYEHALVANHVPDLTVVAR
jgi:DNA-binding NarL/FixJ family response regulator